MALTRTGVSFRLLGYDHDPASHDAARGYGAAAATALGLPADQVFKTLVAEVDGQLAVAVVPVTATLDLKALAAALGGKRAAMADPAAAERATGYVRGSISPLGQRRPLPTVVDESALGHALVYVSAGRRGLEIELAPGDLLRLTGGRAAPLRRAAH